MESCQIIEKLTNIKPLPNVGSSVQSANEEKIKSLECYERMYNLAIKRDAQREEKISKLEHKNQILSAYCGMKANLGEEDAKTTLALVEKIQ